MGLGSFFRFKKTKPASVPPEVKEETSEKETSAPPLGTSEDAAELDGANVAYPFHDVKTIELPTPLAIDAKSESKNERLPAAEDKEREKEDDAKSNEIVAPPAIGACDSKSCTKENCGAETCESAVKDHKASEEKEVSEGKMTPNQLTEIINTSIKEAMQTIVKQSRMDEKNDTDQKPKKELRKSVGYANKEEISMKAKQFNRSRSLKNGVQPPCLSSTCIARIAKKSRDESVKKNGVEDKKIKKHGKLPSNMKTDNRKMTGNVNIYICSEATENPVTSNKQKKASPDMETSSETTTNQSNVSSCKLVNCIRKKRRECKQCNSLEFLPKSKESSDNSNDCSCPSKSSELESTSKLESNDFINVSNASVDIVSVEDTASTLTDCQCKDLEMVNSSATASKSSTSILRSKFVICDKLEPCAMIYPSKMLSSTDSDKWSSKSICSSVQRAGYDQSSESDQDVVLRDENAKDGWSLEPKTVPCNYHAKNYNRDYNACAEKNYKMHSKRNFVKICKCQKRDDESVVNCNASSNYKSSRHRTAEKPDSPQPRSICSCIVEEEEEDAPCRGRRADLDGKDRETEKPVAVTSEENEEGKPEQEPGEKEAVEGSEKGPVDESVDAGKATDSDEQKTGKQGEDSSPQGAIVKPFTSPRLIRPEARMLKRLLQRQEMANAGSAEPGSYVVKHVDASNELVKNVNEPQAESKKEPAFLKKFNLPMSYKWATPAANEEAKETQEEPAEKQLENASIEKAEDESKETKETKKQSPLFSVLKKILHRKDQSKAESLKSQEDKTVENTLADKDNDAPAESKSYGNSSAQKSKGEKKETVKKNETEKKTKEASDNAKEEPEKLVSDINEEKKKEKATDSSKETVSKSKLLASIISKKLTPSSRQSVSAESTKLKKSQGLLKESETEVIDKQPKIHEPAKTDMEMKTDDERRKEDESVKASRRAETMSRKPTDTKRYPAFNEGTMCAECCRRKSSMRMPKPIVDFHTVCTNPKFLKCTSINDNFMGSVARLEKDRCNCCCLPPSECNDFLNYPKSCLKKETPPSRGDWQESVPYHDNRSWEECGCRKVIVCNGCCRPRNECSCRVPITCSNCCKPNLECNCQKFHKRRDNYRRMKSMFCLYCDNPQEKCTCRGPIEKCSCCELSMDMCACGDRKTFCTGRPVQTEGERKTFCAGRPVQSEGDRKTFCTGRPVLTEPSNDHTMYVTAWEPREEVRRYFSRNLENRRVDSVADCCCHKLMQHNSDDLPYQRLSVFSDVMDELQQKMSESSCCTQCRKSPCCCNIKIDKEKGRDERKIKYCVSPKSRRKIVAVCMEQVNDKSQSIRCKCDSSQMKNEKPMKIIVPICCVCETTPCRCKKSKSSPKKPKPKAKCYYCKTLPCACITSREHSKPRPCRCADSPRRAKEKEIIPCGKISTKPKNNEEKTICVR